jgi:thiol-disulfide isomerase/thioredoxin
LPELRVYNSRGQLVYASFGFHAGQAGRAIDNALAKSTSVAGPALSESLAELQTADGRAASLAVTPGKPVVIDYWAVWCVPCKYLSKELASWAEHHSGSGVEVVRAETDLMKAARMRGEKTYLVKKDANGKLVKTEIR